MNRAEGVNLNLKVSSYPTDESILTTEVALI